ncbi:MAG: hypothetical protein WEF28_13940 [Acidimicrobiia bacterium]
MPVDDFSGSPSPPRIGMKGIEVDVPSGWECRIRQAGHTEDTATVLPVLHAATVALSADRADYGGGVVEKLRDGDVFISLIEFGEEAVGSNLYPPVDAIPQVDHSMFNPFQLQRSLPGQAGTQVFFTYSGRAFCMYVVLGSFGRRVSLAARANEIIRSLSIEAL